MSVLSPLSMATTTTATPTQFTSSALCTKLSNLTFPHTHLLPISLKPKSLHPLRLKARSFIFLSPLRCTNESLEVEAEESESLTEEKPVEENEEVEEEEEKKVQEDGEEARLYVGNLPYSMSSSEIADVFAQAGSVANVEVMYDRVTDRSRGFAFVTMGSVEEAKEVIRMFDGSQVGGRTVKVNFPEVPKGGERKVLGPRIRESYKNFVDSPHKIYAGNLGWRLTSDGLKNAFAGQPGFLSAKVIYERDTGRSRGFGFVTFESADDVQTALNAMNGVEVEGRPLRLNLAAERAPSTPSASNSETSVESSELITSGSA